MRDSELVARARELRLAGLSLIPARLDKRPLIPTWKKYQTTPPTDAEFDNWARLRPPAWAALTGASHGIAVLDFDGEIGNETMRGLNLRPHVLTGSGGHHVYFRYPDWPVRGVSGKTFKELGKQYPGLDVKGDGGYVVCLGQNNYGSYSWLRDLDLYSVDLLPRDLRRLLHRSRQLPDIAEQLVERALEQALADGRNNTGLWLGCQLRDAGLSEQDAGEALNKYVRNVSPNNRKGLPEPYTHAEALSTLRQAYSRDPRAPWSNGTTPRTELVAESLPEIEVGNRELRDVSTECLQALRRKSHKMALSSAMSATGIALISSMSMVG
jgi:hypothetical protein